jgi:hypothetical protein
VQTNDQVPDPIAAPRLGPSLPQRAAPPVGSTDVWMGVEAEAAHLHQTPEQTDPEHRSQFQLPTVAPRLLATVGWLGNIATIGFLIGALLPAYRDGEPNHLVLSVDDARWFGAALIFSSLAIYVGWFWWSVSAAYNAGRLAARTTSPWLPVVVYLAAPVAIVMGADATGPNSDYVQLAGWALLGLGHLAVVASIRGTADRIGASVDEFAKLLWLPLAWASYRFMVTVMVTLYGGPWRHPATLVALSAIEGLFPLGLAFATWRATRSFTQACHRLNHPVSVRDLPSSELIAAAIHQRAVEGR